MLLRKKLDNEDEDSENSVNFEIQYVIVNGHVMKASDQINPKYFGEFVELSRQSGSC